MPVQHIAFFSSALFSRKTCVVYVPKSYDSGDADKAYPVIYLLHGMYGSELDWTMKGGAEAALDRMIANGQLRETIVVMPSDGGYGHGTFYMDWYDGTGAFEQYMIDDVLPAIDSKFRTIAGRDNRAISGLSMGGYGAHYLALRYPELFGAAASMSGPLSSIERLDDRVFIRSDFPRIFGPRSGAYAAERDLFKLLELRSGDECLRPKLYVTCGTEDELYPYNQGYLKKLDSLQYPYRQDEHSGGHTWDYWQQYLPEVLLFIEQTFPSA
jgi:enterochelin esterase-like enzyme